MKNEVEMQRDEIKVVVRFQCNYYNQKECSGYRKSPTQNYCVYGLYERICYNEKLRIKYFIKECEGRAINKGCNRKKEQCDGLEWLL